MTTFDLEAIRYKLREMAPYFGSIIWSLRPVPDKEFGFRDEKGGIHGTFAVTENGVLIYNPEVDWTFEECVGGLCHEIHHLILRHHRRRMDRDSQLWNYAADLEINSPLTAGGWKLPEMAIHPSQFKLPDNETAEFYFNRLLDNAVKITIQVPGVGSGQCGSCSGHSADGEPQGKEGSGPVDANGKPVQGLTEVELDAISKRIAEDVVKHRGTAPGNLVEWADGLLNPRIPWQRVLRSTVKRCVNIVSGGATDFSFLKSSDRRNDSDLILPRLVTYKPEVAVVLDTSGSMGMEEFVEGISEICGIVRHLTQTIAVVLCDADVHGVHKVADPGSIRKVPFAGRGGTDMRVGMEHAARLHPKPNILVVFTDGYTPWPEQKPRNMQVVVCLSSKGADLTTAPHWARTVKIGD